MIYNMVLNKYTEHKDKAVLNNRGECLTGFDDKICSFPTLGDCGQNTSYFSKRLLYNGPNKLVM